MRRRSGFRSIVTYVAAALIFTAATLSLQAQRIPQGTTIVVRNNSTLDSGKVNNGQHWSGTLVGDLSVRGRVVAANGSRVRGVIADAESSGRLSKPGMLALQVTSVNGIAVTTDMYARDGEGHTKSNIAKSAAAPLSALFWAESSAEARARPSEQPREAVPEPLAQQLPARKKQRSTPNRR